LATTHALRHEPSPAQAARHFSNAVQVESALQTVATSQHALVSQSAQLALGAGRPPHVVGPVIPAVPPAPPVPLVPPVPEPGVLPVVQPTQPKQAMHPIHTTHATFRVIREQC